MRAAFVDALCTLAQKDARIMLITGDLGYRFLDKFADRFPDQFLNIGVAEANLVSVAAGLSTCGYVPFIYSIATFASLRAFEQIRTDISMQNLNVKIVGIGAGLTYTKAGPTHHSLEDISMMRTLSNMVIIDPVDTFEAREATLAIAKYVGPVYLRLERNPQNPVRLSPVGFKIGIANIIEQGKDVVIFVTGTKIELARELSALLVTHKINPTIVEMPTVRPLDNRLLTQLSKVHKVWVTLEEHARNGGLGSEILEWVNDSEIADNVKIIRFGLTKLMTATGDYSNLMAQNGMTAGRMVQQILRLT
jgi:transketolase